MNVAVVDPAGPGFLTLYPCSDRLPLASTINYGPGETRANGAVPSLSDEGELCIFTLTDADVIVDVSGSSVQDSEFFATGVPRRVLDSRPGESTFDDEFAGIGRRPARSVTRLLVDRRPFSTEYADVLINVAAVNPADFGYLTVYPCTPAIPNASNVNYAPGQTVANGVLAKVSDSGEICIFTLAETDLVVDITGAVTPYSGVEPIAPVRLADSRPGEQTADAQFAGFGRLEPDSVLRLPIAGRAGIPGEATSVLLNLTAVGSDVPGFLTAYPCGDVPTVSNVNYLPGTVVPNNATVRLAANGDLCIYTLAAVDIVVDVTGFER